MICDNRLLEYEPLWNIGMYRKDGKWHLDRGKHPTLIFTTEEAKAYVERLYCNH